jgi:hypothetical protein
MRKLTLRATLLAVLLVAGCTLSGQPAPNYPSPGTSWQDKPWGSDVGGNQM